MKEQSCLLLRLEVCDRQLGWGRSEGSSGRGSDGDGRGLGAGGLLQVLDELHLLCDVLLVGRCLRVGEAPGHRCPVGIAGGWIQGTLWQSS